MMLRSPRPLSMLAMLFCAACALIGTHDARADLNIVFPPVYVPAITINANVSGNLNISNPFHSPAPLVIIAPSAKISGGVTVHDDVTVQTMGQVSGTLATYNTSRTQIITGSLGAVHTYDTSLVYTGNTSSLPVTLGGLECYDHSTASCSGYAVSATVDSITTDYVFAHDNAAVKLYHVNVTHDLQADGYGDVEVEYAKADNVWVIGSGLANLYYVRCAGYVLQQQSGTIILSGQCRVGSVVYAAGWPNEQMPAGYFENGITIGVGGSVFSDGIYAMGAPISIQSGYFVKGPLYAKKRVAKNGYTPTSMRVYGTNLYISAAGVLTGTLSDGVPINTPCSGQVELVNK